MRHVSNNVIVLDAIRRGGDQVSKKDLQQLTGLSWGTMCKVANTLLDDGYLTAQKVKPTAPGRPSIPLHINPDAAYFCGMDMGAAFTRLVFCDLTFKPLYELEIATTPYRDQERFLDGLATLYQRGLQASGLPPEKVHSLGLAISGKVDNQQQIIMSGGNFGMKFGTNISFSSLSRRLGLRVTAVTTQVAAVCAEYHFGEFAGRGNLINVGLGVGIGSGVVANHLLLDSHPLRPVGYIGHILIPGNNHRCSCGFKGCLEAFSGANNLAKIARERIPDHPELHSAEALDKAAAEGNPKAKSIMDTAARYNAIGIATMIQLCTPEALIFSGGQSKADGYLFQKMLMALKKILPPERSNFITAITTLGHGQAALGAARLAFENFF